MRDRDLRVIHHHSLDLITDLEGWIAAHVRLAAKWGPRFGDDGAGSDDWVQRARRAEAEAAAERLMHGRERLVTDAIQARDAARIADLEDHPRGGRENPQLADYGADPGAIAAAVRRRFRTTPRCRFLTTLFIRASLEAGGV